MNFDIISVDEILETWGSVEEYDFDEDEEEYIFDENQNPIYLYNSLGNPLDRKRWQEKLNIKRQHLCYSEILYNIQHNGFLMPLCYSVVDNIKIHGDGHHRLAAAIELGYTKLPYLYFDDIRNAFGDLEDFINIEIPCKFPNNKTY